MHSDEKTAGARAAQCLSMWLGVDRKLVETHLGSQTLGELGLVLLGRKASRSKRYGRLVLEPLYSRMGASLRYKLAGGAKRARGLRQGQANEIASLPFTAAFRQLRKELGACPPWNGKRSALCITHDVDYTTCYDAVDLVAQMEKDHGLRSTFNFLTNWDYEIDPELVHRLEAQGFEIGLHGRTHDIALGFRRKEHIKRALLDALGRLPAEAKGFRSPALSFSYGLLEALDETGFRYDSTVKVGAQQSPGVGTCFPYRYPGLSIWEVPLAISDDFLFRDLGLDDDSAFRMTTSVIEEIADLGGVTVFNSHPTILRGKTRFYSRLLDYVSSSPSLWSCTVRDVVEHLEQVEHERC